jgi:N-succinyl-L-ornithine transcarbamylase
MQHFTSVSDVDDLPALLAAASDVAHAPHAWPDLGHKKTMCCLFFNPSLRTRLSTQKAAYNLGMHVMIMNIGIDGWQLEFEDGSIMGGNKAEHVREAAAVVGSYCDVLGIRAFATFEDKEKDCAEEILQAFKKYAGVPIISLESATRHPCQSLADIITIESYKRKKRPKVVLSWVPHPKALPQAVANSFAEWAIAAEYDLVVTHPHGYELDEQFVPASMVEYDPEKAFADADFVYAKNWSSFHQYGQILTQDPAWQISEARMALTNNAYFMHCLPVRRNVVVADAVIDSPASLVIQQAANRVVAAQTVLKEMVG